MSEPTGQPSPYSGQRPPSVPTVFVQLAVASDPENGEVLYALDAEGRVWERQPDRSVTPVGWRWVEQVYPRESFNGAR